MTRAFYNEAVEEEFRCGCGRTFVSRGRLVQHQAKTGHTDEAEAPAMPEESFEHEYVTYAEPWSERPAVLGTVFAGISQLALIALNWIGDMLLLVSGGLFGLVADALQGVLHRLGSVQESLARYSRDFYCLLFLVQAGAVIFLFGLGLGRCLAVHLGMELDHAWVGAAVTLFVVRPRRLNLVQKIS